MTVNDIYSMTKAEYTGCTTGRLFLVADKAFSMHSNIMAADNSHPPSTVVQLTPLPRRASMTTSF